MKPSGQSGRRRSRCKGHIDFDGRIAQSWTTSIQRRRERGRAGGHGQSRSPLAYALGKRFRRLKLKGVTLEIASVDRKNQLQIADVTAPAPGASGRRSGNRTSRSPAKTAWKLRRPSDYRVPVGAPLGHAVHHRVRCAAAPICWISSRPSVSPAHSPAQVLEILNSLREQQNLRADLANGAVLHVGGPRSAGSAALARHDSRRADSRRGMNLLNWRGSKVAEIEIPAGEA